MSLVVLLLVVLLLVVLLLAVKVLFDVLFKLRTKELDKEESDEAGSGDLASASVEDLSDRVDDRHEGEEGEKDNEHEEGDEGLHRSCPFYVRATSVRLNKS